MIGRIRVFAEQYLDWLSLPTVTLSDILEIIILTFLIYHLLLWFKETRAWSLLKGILSIVLFIFLAYVLQMSTILWLVNRMLNVVLIAVIILFQPELRRALQQLGQKGFFSSLFSMDSLRSNNTERFSDRTINELVRACYEMGQNETGALIVIEQKVSLKEYEQTGIEVDAVVSAQLLMNIFEHNTPLHDGAVVMRGDRVAAATCYLPLTGSDSLSKSLGTRHRAGVGVSENTDCLTIIVSEETGAVSVASEGKLLHNISSDELREQLQKIQNKPEETENRLKLKKWKGRKRHEKKAH